MCMLVTGKRSLTCKCNLEDRIKVAKHFVKNFMKTNRLYESVSGLKRLIVGVKSEAMVPF